jgi:hypothetical protein
MLCSIAPAAERTLHLSGESRMPWGFTRHGCRGRLPVGLLSQWRLHGARTALAPADEQSSDCAWLCQRSHLTRLQLILCAIRQTDVFRQLISSANRRLWHHLAAFPHRPRWQRGVLHAVWIGMVALAVLWIFKFDCPIC